MIVRAVQELYKRGVGSGRMDLGRWIGCFAVLWRWVMSVEFYYEPYPELEPPEPKRRRGWWVLVVGLVIVAMLGSGIGGVFWFVSLREEPETAVSVPSVAVNRIAFINPNGQLVTMSPDGSNQRVLTDLNLRFQFPAWSPNGRSLAVIGSQAGGGGIFLISDEDEAEPEAIYNSTSQAPFYLYWSPDGRYLSFLVNHPGGIGLRLIQMDDTERNSRLISLGVPFYWDWTPDSQQLLIHTGFAGEAARLTFIEPGGEVSGVNIAPPGFFQAPDISPDGRFLAYAEERSPGVSALVVEDTATDSFFTQQHLGLIALGWSPVDNRLAFISNEENTDSFWGPMRLLDAETDRLTLLTAETVVAFFWSPDGRYLAYISVPGKDNGINARRSGRLTKLAAQPNPHEFSLSVVDTYTGDVNLLARFTPTNSFLHQFLPFFDQYALSHHLWSPHSDALVLPMLQNGVEQVVVVSVNGEPPHILTEGDMPFWSWR
ncbi:MAG: hypothetical protein D6706_19590 [Chloroflexi bacterium]|nr:MAG: hypothetical protein D6706_19590 [Chloroflexota bacterium]